MGWDSPSGPVVKNPPARGHGFNPWSGEIPHAVEELSPCATTTEPVLWIRGAATTEPRDANTEDHAPRARAPRQEKSLQ